jgi:hypothetical protein
MIRSLENKNFYRKAQEDREENPEKSLCALGVLRGGKFWLWLQ